MKNKRTTISGFLLLAGAIFIAGGQMLAGDTPDLSALLTALAGVGFLVSGDGGL